MTRACRSAAIALVLHLAAGVAFAEPAWAAALEARAATLDAPGFTAAVLRGGDLATHAGGFRDEGETEAMRPGDRFRLASVTKLYLAAAVLQLVDEGKLDLNETIDRYVGGVPHGDAITLRMLGRHESGLDDAIRQMPFHRALAAEPGRAWPAGELLRYALEPGPRSAPGEAWHYSNANSILLGLAVERATGRSWQDHVRTRILAPLGLTRTGFDAGPVDPRGYRYGKPDDPVGYGTDWFDATGWSAGWTGAAGSMTGDAADTARFLAALFGGDLLSEDGRAELIDFARTGDSGFFYGFHCHRVGVSGSDAVGFGHHGDVPGYSSSAVWLPESRTAFVVLANLSAELDKQTTATKLGEAALPTLARPGGAADRGVPAALEAAVRGIVGGSAVRRAAVVVVEDGRASEPLGAGSADGSGRFRAGSVSKLLTALLALRAEEAGVLSLDTAVLDLLPGSLEGPGAERVTLAHLLEHTAGLPGSSPAEYAADAPGLDPLDYVRERAPLRLRWAPGLHHSYANAGVTVAAAMVEAAWGAGFDALMRREVLGPLGMADTDFAGAGAVDAPPSFAADGQRVMPPWRMPVRPAGSVVTTAADLGRLLEALLADDGSFLSPAALVRLHEGRTSPVARAGGGAGVYGLGNFPYIANGRSLRGHWGRTEGYQASVAYLPGPPGVSGGGRGYVLLVDTADRAAVSRLRSALDGHATRGLPAAAPAASVGPAPDAVAGLYENASHDSVQRAWLFALLDARRLTPTPDGLAVAPALGGPPTAWTQTAPGLYRADGLAVASGATFQAGGDAFWADGESYRRVSAWSWWGRWTALASGLLAAAAAPLLWLLVVLVPPLRSALLLPATALGLAGLALLVLVGGFVGFHLGGDLSTIARLGRVGPASLTLLAASVLAPLALAAGLLGLAPRYRSRAAWALAAGLALPMAAAVVLLWSSGMIPCVSWA
ncbi:serine hydrolase [Phycisphaera mikurensis]|uniref:Peptidase S12 family protein n=1 Tax=Phycisphaera mikurensis (strain NBRC 102666 / KCTC 22515 / FYK2301M01) TaxID=1142394 RepID=I0IH98_PHYMF|nr:serine hydrolase domain-containing protein [Phycisphaera mikurensis]MBB6440885.1 CubicO group peptidase (beta-lactamase class C family) [Phycisphaera mikurensis]BAM04636.1 peptidase S12 family protein [Phycisphaera mikurensis NBRC 102666]